MPEIIQPSLAGGEISPSLYGRVDLARYANSLRTCRNWIVRPYGGVENRPGLQFIAEVKTSAKEVLLVDFQFSTEQAYVLEFGDQYLRIIKDGGLLTPAGAPAYSGATTYAKDDYVTSGGLTYRSLQDGNTGNAPASSPSWWAAATIYEITSPYTEAELDLLKWTQSADVLTLVHPDHPPQELRRNSEIDWEFVDFDYQNGPFLDTNTTASLLVHASAATGTVTLTATSSVFTAAHVGALFRLEQKDLSEVPPWESTKTLARSGGNPLGLLRRSDGKVYKCVTSFVPTGDDDVQTGSVRPTHASGTAADGDGSSINGTDIAKQGVEWLYMHSGYGICRITAVASGTSATATVLVTLPEAVVGGAVSAAGPWTMTGDGVDTTLSVPGATSSDPTDYEVTFDGAVQSPTSYTVDAGTDVLTFNVAPANTVAVSARQLSQDRRTSLWAFGAWSEDQGYPRAVAYFGDRLWFGGTTGRPSTVWCSKVSNYTDFGISTPSVDDDAITATINSRLVNQIHDIVPLTQLLILTSSSEWLVTGGQDQVITPSTLAFKPQSYRGSADLQARVIGNSAVYVQNRGQTLRDLAYTLEADGFDGTDLSLLAIHLFRGYSIVSIAYGQIPWSTLWAVRSDGALLGMTYQRDQQVVGWHRHDSAGGVFERVCCIPEGDEDALYVVVRRTVNGSSKRYIERLHSREFAEDADIFFVDSGLTYDGANATPGNTVTLSGGTLWNTTELLTLTAGGALTFASGDVGDEIWVDPLGTDTVPLQLTIISRTDATHLVVQPQRNVGTAYRNVALAAWSFARDTVSGLSHLEGQQVVAMADGNDLGDFTVASGAITLTTPGAKVHVGLRYDCDLEPLDLNLSGAESIRLRPKLIKNVGVLIEATRGLKVGRDANNLYDVKQRSTEPLTSPVARRTGVFDVPCTSSWGNGTSFLIRQDRPLPATVLALIPEVDIGNR